MPASYGLPAEPSEAGPADWQRAREQLVAARNYWIVTCGAGGRPHAMPVWGVWLDDALLFSTGRASRKGRDLAANPRVVAHLESGDDAVILEGAVEELTDAATLARFADAYEAKYAFRPDTTDPANVTYALAPRVAFTWLEADFVRSATRWTFAAV
jgi:nitroimidazol reductase NimA-like FMN-containing flavoprotein (pyridoxamine 5'-phosphate oxidase superfamily)